MLTRQPPLSTKAAPAGWVGSISVEANSAGTLGRVRRIRALAARTIVRPRPATIALAVPLHRLVRPGALLARAVAILGQSDLVEHQGRSLDEPDRHQAEGQVLPESTAERERASDARDDEQPGGAEAYDPRSSAQAAPPAVITDYSSESSSASGTSSSASSSTNPSEERPSPMPSRSERSGSGPPNPVRPSPSVRPSSAARSS
jgi:hypothetical protein